MATCTVDSVEARALSNSSAESQSSSTVGALPRDWSINLSRNKLRMSGFPIKRSNLALSISRLQYPQEPVQENPSRSSSFVPRMTETGGQAWQAPPRTCWISSFASSQPTTSPKVTFSGRLKLRHAMITWVWIARRGGGEEGVQRIVVRASKTTTWVEFHCLKPGYTARALQIVTSWIFDTI